MYHFKLSPMSRVWFLNAHRFEFPITHAFAAFSYCRYTERYLSPHAFVANSSNKTHRTILAPPPNRPQHQMRSTSLHLCFVASRGHFTPRSTLWTNDPLDGEYLHRTPRENFASLGGQVRQSVRNAPTSSSPHRVIITKVLYYNWAICQPYTICALKHI